MGKVEMANEDQIMTKASQILKLMLGASAFALFAAAAHPQDAGEDDDTSIFQRFPGMSESEEAEEELMEELQEAEAEAEEELQEAEGELMEVLDEVEEEGQEAESEIMEVLEEVEEDGQEAEGELMETLEEADEQVAEGEEELMETLEEGETETEAEAGTDETTVSPAGLVPSGTELSPEAEASAAGVECADEGTCIVEATGQPLRILPRSFAALYAAPEADADVLSNAVSAFKPAFVFDRQGVDLSDPTDPKGWYQVGYSQRSPIGWMKAADVVEWRQALLLEYIHPGTGRDKRTPVVMFNDKASLSGLVTGGGRTGKVDDILEDIESGNRPDGVIGREPGEFLNINESFYLLPIIQWEREQAFDEPAHYLQLFAAVPGARAESAGEGTLESDNFLEETLTSVPEETQVDIVFVMDMTGSMQPYMDRVKDAVGQLATSLDNNSDLDFRFGLVGYRDSIDVTPGLEWTTKNFTPELVKAGDLEALLESEAKAAALSSDEWAEDVHGGYLEGVNSAWRESDDKRQMRFIILVGDASGHDLGGNKKAKNSAGMTEEELVNLARGKNIYSLGLYLQDDRAEPDWQKGVSQFGQLAALPDGRGQGVVPVDADAAADEESGIGATTEFVGMALVDFITADMSTRREMAEEIEPVDTDEEAPEDIVKSIEVARGVLQAGMVDWLGDGAQAPKDFVSWAFDQDLKDLTRPALAVRVMMTREQLDNVIRQSETLLDALDTNILGQVDFLTSLKLASAQTSLGLEVDPDLSLGDQEFLPQWVAALPYRSRVLGMTPSEFTNLSSSERIEFRASLEAKYNSYREIANTPGVWIQLDEGDTELQKVTSIPLALLP